MNKLLRNIQNAEIRILKERLSVNNGVGLLREKVRLSPFKVMAVAGGIGFLSYTLISQYKTAKATGNRTVFWHNLSKQIASLALPNAMGLLSIFYKSKNDVGEENV